jgi:streptogramin lyase
MTRTLFQLLFITLLLLASEALAHPGSGIVVDRQGNVYFVDTGSGIWKIDRTGNLTRIPGPAYHWMAIDVDGRLSEATLPYYSSEDATITRVGSNPTLLLSSDFPIVVGSDGSLYYPWAHTGKHSQIVRLEPSGRTSVVKTLPPVRSKDGEIRWRNGIAISQDGSIYYTEDRAVKKITPQGELVTIVSDLEVPGCGSMVGVEAESGTYCRGLAVDTEGSVYVAATGCGAVIKITPDKKVSTVLRTASPWSPTAVALYGSELYVLEYLHTPGDNRREWLPRVRKVSPDGTVVMIAAVNR